MPGPPAIIIVIITIVALHLFIRPYRACRSHRVTRLDGSTLTGLRQDLTCHRRARAVVSIIVIISHHHHRARLTHRLSSSSSSSPRLSTSTTIGLGWVLDGWVSATPDIIALHHAITRSCCTSAPDARASSSRIVITQAPHGTWSPTSGYPPSSDHLVAHRQACPSPGPSSANRPDKRM